MKIKLLLLVFAVVFTTTNLRAADFTVNGITYTITSAEAPYTVAVTKKSPVYAGAVTIPSNVSYNSISYSVTSIGDHAFEYCDSLTSIIIPNAVASIGANAFKYCTSLTAVTIPNSVISVGDHAFDYCTGLTSVTIGNSVTSIGDFAFINCTGLSSVTIGNSVTSIGFNAFYGCNGLTSVTIPNSVTSIGSGAFMYCSCLFSVNSNNPNYSGNNGVLYNKAQTTLIQCPVSKTGNFDIPLSVTTIGPSAFAACTGLTAVTIPNSVISIGSNAFDGCTGLTSATFPNSVTSTGYYTFNGCTGLTSVNIPNSVTTIGTYTFMRCSGLTFVIIPNSVTSIGYGAFASCTGLTAVTIPASVTSIKDHAFAYCTGLNSIYADSPIPVELSNSIDVFLNVNKTKCTLYMPLNSKNLYNAADEWKGFTNIIERNTDGFTVNGIAYLITSSTAPKTVEVAYGGTYTNAITIPASVSYNSISYSVTSIGNYAFHQCTGLTSVTIPGSVIAIGTYAFYGCTGLTSLTIPSSVKFIGKYAFTFNSCLFYVDSNNSNYSSIDGVLYNKNQTTLIQCPVSKTGGFVIPSTVTSIADGAFKSCSGLSSVSLHNSVTSIGDRAFESCTGLTSFILPNSLTYIGNYSFYKCTGLTTVTITASVTTLPNSVTSIGDYAFDKCTSLISLYANNEIPINLRLNTASSYTGFNSNIILYVPTGSKSLYASAPVWKDFKNIVEHIITGLENRTDDNLTNIYPNPNPGKFMLALDSRFTGEVSVCVSSLSGGILKTLRFMHTYDQVPQSIDLGTVTPGIYFVEIQGNGFKAVKKIIVK